MDEIDDFMQTEVSDSQMNDAEHVFSQNATSIPKEREKCCVVSSVPKCVPFTALIMLQWMVTVHYCISWTDLVQKGKADFSYAPRSWSPQWQEIPSFIYKHGILGVQNSFTKRKQTSFVHWSYSLTKGCQVIKAIVSSL